MKRTASSGAGTALARSSLTAPTPEKRTMGRLVLVVTYDGETATGRVVLSSRHADAEMAERVRDDDRYARVRPRDDGS
ncbi:MAG: hypothetical protein SangKO_078850 [Sandaracinaceae bacterium]